MNPTLRIEDWASRPATELIAFLRNHQHPTLRRTLPGLEVMAHKVLKVHGDKDPERLRALARELSSLRHDLEAHLDDEAERVFARLGVEEDGVLVAVDEMLADHADHVRRIDRLRVLTSNYQAPANACGTWRALWQGLSQLEEELLQQLALEDQVLYQKARSPRPRAQRRQVVGD